MGLALTTIVLFQKHNLVGPAVALFWSTLTGSQGTLLNAATASGNVISEVLGADPLALPFMTIVVVIGIGFLGARKIAGFCTRFVRRVFLTVMRCMVHISRMGIWIIKQSKKRWILLLFLVGATSLPYILSVLQGTRAFDGKGLFVLAGLIPYHIEQRKIPKHHVDSLMVKSLFWQLNMKRQEGKSSWKLSFPD